MIGVPAPMMRIMFALMHNRSVRSGTRTAEEAGLEEVERPELAAVRQYALASGLRIRPIITLTWAQIDWANETIQGD